MPAPTITFLYNNSQENLPNTGNQIGDSRWKILDCINDKIAFLGEDTENNDSNSSRNIFVIPESGSVEVPRQFVNKYSEGKWKRIWLGGSNRNEGKGGNYRYAYGIFVDGTTSSAPVLQAWDSVLNNSYDLEVLGRGAPRDSMLRAISTTHSSPGEQWEGTPLAGGSVLYSIALTTGPVTFSRMLYWNMRLVIPSWANPFSASPVLCVYFTFQ